MSRSHHARARIKSFLISIIWADKLFTLRALSIVSKASTSISNTKMLRGGSKDAKKQPRRSVTLANLRVDGTAAKKAAAEEEAAAEQKQLEEQQKEIDAANQQIQDEAQKQSLDYLKGVVDEVRKSFGGASSSAFVRARVNDRAELSSSSEVEDTPAPTKMKNEDEDDVRLDSPTLEATAGVDAPAGVSKKSEQHEGTEIRAGENKSSSAKNPSVTVVAPPSSKSPAPAPVPGADNSMTQQEHREDVLKKAQEAGEQAKAAIHALIYGVQLKQLNIAAKVKHFKRAATSRNITGAPRSMFDISDDENNANNEPLQRTGLFDFSKSPSGTPKAAPRRVLSDASVLTEVDADVGVPDYMPTTKQTSRQGSFKNAVGRAARSRKMKAEGEAAHQHHSTASSGGATSTDDQKLGGPGTTSLATSIQELVQGLAGGAPPRQVSGHSERTQPGEDDATERYNFDAGAGQDDDEDDARSTYLQSPTWRRLPDFAEQPRLTGFPLPTKRHVKHQLPFEVPPPSTAFPIPAFKTAGLNDGKAWIYKEDSPPKSPLCICENENQNPFKVSKRLPEGGVYLDEEQEDENDAAFLLARNRDNKKMSQHEAESQQRPSCGFRLLADRATGNIGVPVSTEGYVPDDSPTLRARIVNALYDAKEQISDALCSPREELYSPATSKSTVISPSVLDVYFSKPGAKRPPRRLRNYVRNKYFYRTKVEPPASRPKSGGGGRSSIPTKPFKVHTGGRSASVFPALDSEVDNAPLHTVLADYVENLREIQRQYIRSRLLEEDCDDQVRRYYHQEQRLEARIRAVGEHPIKPRYVGPWVAQTKASRLRAESGRRRRQEQQLAYPKKSALVPSYSQLMSAISEKGARSYNLQWPEVPLSANSSSVSSTVSESYVERPASAGRAGEVLGEFLQRTESKEEQDWLKRPPEMKNSFGPPSRATSGAVSRMQDKILAVDSQASQVLSLLRLLKEQNGDISSLGHESSAESLFGPQ
ncbi:unnamed protein product [Amoebophrya sp. A120]|nr:unnamed protein product [Amoebophrya sp. A120]|eukprot:GSA120T00001723001.1